MRPRAVKLRALRCDRQTGFRREVFSFFGFLGALPFLHNPLLTTVDKGCTGEVAFGELQIKETISP